MQSVCSIVGCYSNLFLLVVRGMLDSNNRFLPSIFAVESALVIVNEMLQLIQQAKISWTIYTSSNSS